MQMRITDTVGSAKALYDVTINQPKVRVPLFVSPTHIA